MCRPERSRRRAAQKGCGCAARKIRADVPRIVPLPPLPPDPGHSTRTTAAAAELPATRSSGFRPVTGWRLLRALSVVRNTDSECRGAGRRPIRIRVIRPWPGSPDPARGPNSNVNASGRSARAARRRRRRRLPGWDGGYKQSRESGLSSSYGRLGPDSAGSRSRKEHRSEPPSELTFLLSAFLPEAGSPECRRCEGLAVRAGDCQWWPSPARKGLPVRLPSHCRCFRQRACPSQPESRWTRWRRD